MKQRKVLMIRPTLDCNNRCKYCYIDYQKDSMSLETVDLIVDRIHEHLQTYPFDYIECLWHGGEPSLMPQPFWEYVERAFSKLDTRRVTKSFQTNLLTPETGIYHWLLDHGYHISSSFDGSYHIHQIGRGLSRSKHAQLMRNVQEIKEATGELGVVGVVSGLTIAHPIEQLKLYEELGINVRFNKVHCKDWEHHIGYSEYYSFMIEVARAWLDREDSLISVNPIEMDVAALFGYGPGVCYRSPHCYIHFLSIELDGSVYPCNRFANLAEWRYGHLSQMTLGEFWLTAFARFSAIRTSMQACNECRWYNVCGGGCKWERHQDDESEKEEFCKSTSEYFDELVDILYSKGASLSIVQGHDCDDTHTFYKGFLRAWDNQDDSINCAKVKFQKGPTGNINLSGVPGDEGPIISKWQSEFMTSIEPGVQALVSILVWDFDFVTYSSCEGHANSTDTRARPTLRRVGLLPRTEKELVHAMKTLCTCAQKANARTRDCRVKVLVKIGTHSVQKHHKTIVRIIFDLEQGCDYSQYFLDVETVYSAFLEELVNAKKEWRRSVMIQPQKASEEIV